MPATNSKRGGSRATRAPAETLYFTVDSALLAELGERLVGKPHIALAELVKNSYDADATKVEIEIDEDRIIVRDNGHGMSRDTFRRFWMRIGSPHKLAQAESPGGRPLTGSKGVGRLAAQFLAHEITLTTKTEGQKTALVADVDWDRAVAAGSLTRAEAAVRRRRSPEGMFPDDADSGTVLELRRLSQEWDAEALEQLAGELWPLRPPFAGRGATDFDIELRTTESEAAERFEEAMGAVLEIYQARIVGELEEPNPERGEKPWGPRTLRIDIKIADGPRRTFRHQLERCLVDDLRYEIRVFDLRYRQPRGISVGKAREYLNQYGGVHIYDAGFHLPYYGRETDWLDIERDHSHRISQSKLLPEELQVEEGLNKLPTNSRLYGVVDVNTGGERRASRRRPKPVPTDALTLQVSRDRLVLNRAFSDLHDAVRYAVDLYAVEETRRALAAGEKNASSEPLPDKVRRVEDVLERHEDRIDPGVMRDLRREVKQVLEAVESEAERAARQAGLLGALATAGISALAFEHEFGRQVGTVERSADRLSAAAERGDLSEIGEIAAELRRGARHARETFRLFAPLLDEDDREQIQSFRARALIRQVLHQLAGYLGPVEVDTSGIDEGLKLPPGRFAEWSALFQNVTINAVNAMAQSPVRKLRFRSASYGRNRALYVDDSGRGVNLEDADRLFEPFEREGELANHQRLIGYGGTGLGLTIVRMMATNLGCNVGFVKPPDDFATSFRISWRAA